MLLDFDSLVKEIRAKRKELGWSQKELAERADVSQSLVAKLERKENVPNYESIKRIYDSLQENKKTEYAEDFANDEIISVDIGEKVDKAIKLMLEHDYSQIPVKDSDEYIGMVLSSDVVDENKDRHVEEIMKNSFPILPARSPKSVVVELLKEKKYNAVMIKDENNNWKIVTPADLL